MIEYSILFGHHAEEDAIIANEWYKQHNEELADSFKRRLNSKIESLKKNPLTPSFNSKKYRSARIKPFPYNIIFKIKRTQIHIVAIFHHARNPQEWKKRI